MKWVQCCERCHKVIFESIEIKRHKDDYYVEETSDGLCPECIKNKDGESKINGKKNERRKGDV